MIFLKLISLLFSKDASMDGQDQIVPNVSHYQDANMGHALIGLILAYVMLDGEVTYATNQFASK